VNELGALEWGEDRFAVWGGQFAPQHWRDFLATWVWPVAETRWGVWEYVSEFEMNDGGLPAADRMGTLERAELFGESGHVNTRRDRERVYWHFVGDKEITVPQAEEYCGTEYWARHNGDMFRRTEKKVLLWGERVGETDRWHDDRVAWAKLIYPSVKSERAQATYYEFTRGGQVAFVWLTGFAGYEEANNG